MSFRRVAFIAIPVVGLSLLGSVAAGAAMRGRMGHPPFPPPWAHGGPAEHRAAVQEIIAQVLGELGATDEQRDQIDAILEPAAEQAEDFRADHEARHEQIRDLLLSETVDRDALEAKRLEAVDRFDEVSQLVTSVVADVAEVLTVEQREELISLVESHRMR